MHRYRGKSPLVLVGGPRERPHCGFSDSFFSSSFFFLVLFTSPLARLLIGRVFIYYSQGGESIDWHERQDKSWGVGAAGLGFVPAPPPFSSLTPAGEAGGSNGRYHWGSGTSEPRSSGLILGGH